MPRLKCQHCGSPLQAERQTRRFCSPTCRVAAHRQAKPNRVKVYTAIRGSNADLIPRVVALYVNDGDTIADVTFGHGTFWRKVNTDRFTLLKSDLVADPNHPIDFRHLPYDDASLDHLVLDPPYAHTPGHMLVDSRYRNRATTQGHYHSDIMGLYRAGLSEAHRVLKPGGLTWCKTQDEIESGRQQWSHIEIYQIATDLGFYGRDLFVVVSGSPPIQHRQQHARRNHSYLWIFQKNASVR